MSGTTRDSTTSTLLGVAALLLWGSFFAVVRGVRDEMGVIQSAAFANLVGGFIGLAVGPIRTGRMRHLLRLPGKYLFGCGGLFVLYNLTLYMAIDKAVTHAQAIEVGLVNYLWPALAVVGTVLILRKRAVWPWLIPGLLLATAGACWAAAIGSTSSFSMSSGMFSNPQPYLLALTAAFCWAFYSTLARRWGSGAAESAAPLFLMATGIGLAIMHTSSQAYIRIPTTPSAFGQLAYLTLFPTLLAYMFWDRSMRRGNVVLLTNLSFFIPLISTLISCIYLDVPIRPGLMAAAGLVVLGAVICKASIRSA